MTDVDPSAWRLALFGAAIAVLSAGVGAGAAVLTTGRQIDSESYRSDKEFLRERQIGAYADFAAAEARTSLALVRFFSEDPAMQTGSFDFTSSAWSDVVDQAGEMHVAVNVVQIVGTRDSIDVAHALYSQLTGVVNKLYVASASQDAAALDEISASFGEYQFSRQQNLVDQFTASARQDLGLLES